MNNDLKELIEAAESLCKTLDYAAQSEKMFCHELERELERINHEAMVMRSNINYLKELMR